MIYSPTVTMEGKSLGVGKQFEVTVQASEDRRLP